MIPKSTQCDSCLQGPAAEMPPGTKTACGIATAAKAKRASRCGRDEPANSGPPGGGGSQAPSTEHGKRSVAKRGQTGIQGSVARDAPGEAVTIGDEKERTKICRNGEAAQHAESQHTIRERERVPDRTETAPATNASSPVDSPHPKDRANTPARNEETEPGLSRHHLTGELAGAGDPPHGRGKIGEPTKEKPRCNGGDNPNSAIIGREESAQPPASMPPSKHSKEEDHTAKWQATNWPEIEARVHRKQRAIHAAFKQGNTKKGHRLQEELLRSHDAKLLAVRNATDPAKGADTPGIDGRKSLSMAQKWRLANSIDIDMKPSPVRRVFVPKPGNTQHRPLGIPTIPDRAIQHLIKLALEPAAETWLAPEQFGFRPGRSPWDAANHIRLRLRQPKFVLDADITKFFDRIDHNAILRNIPGPPCIIKAVRRLLKAGIMEGVELTHPEFGTSQGGPLSPLLANLVLADLPAIISREFPAGRRINDKKIAKPPYICMYADDFIVIHQRHDVLKQVRVLVEQWLADRGLELHADKTAIRHTATHADGYRGFRFLGFDFRHHRIGKNQGGGNGPKWFLWTGPSKEALKQVYADCAAAIDASKRSRKRRGATIDKARKGLATPEEIMVIRLNRIIRGWCGYHRPFFAKETFSKLDHQLFTKLWKWTLREHPKRNRKWVIEHYWNNAAPWRFRFKTAITGKPVELIQAAATPIVRHFQVISNKSWFDGDWAYWATRSGRYPMLIPSAAMALKHQRGRCPSCKQKFVSKDRVSAVRLQQVHGPRSCVMHSECADALRNATTKPVFVESGMIAARCGDDSHAGLTEPHVSRGTCGSTPAAGAAPGTQIMNILSARGQRRAPAGISGGGGGDAAGPGRPGQSAGGDARFVAARSLASRQLKLNVWHSPLTHPPKPRPRAEIGQMGLLIGLRLFALDFIR
jgi:RNA-directed DNA polymerase